MSNPKKSKTDQLVEETQALLDDTFAKLRVLEKAMENRDFKKRYGKPPKPLGTMTIEEAEAFLKYILANRKDAP